MICYCLLLVPLQVEVRTTSQVALLTVTGVTVKDSRYGSFWNRFTQSVTVRWYPFIHVDTSTPPPLAVQVPVRACGRAVLQG